MLEYKFNNKYNKRSQPFKFYGRFTYDTSGFSPQPSCEDRKIQGGFFNWPSPEFAKCWPVSKSSESQTGPPSDQKTPKCLAK